MKPPVASVEIVSKTSLESTMKQTSYSVQIQYLFRQSTLNLRSMFRVPFRPFHLESSHMSTTIQNWTNRHRSCNVDQRTPFDIKYAVCVLPNSQASLRAARVKKSPPIKLSGSYFSMLFCLSRMYPWCQGFMQKVEDGCKMTTTPLMSTPSFTIFCSVLLFKRFVLRKYISI